MPDAPPPQDPYNGQPQGPDPYGQPPPPYGQPPPYPPAYPPPPYNYGQQPYWQAPPGYGYYPVQVSGSNILILSIVGLFCCPICSIVGLIMGISALSAINSGNADPSQRTTVIIGIVISALVLLGCLAYFIMVAVMAAQGTGASSFTTTTNSLTNGS